MRFLFHTSGGLLLPSIVLSAALATSECRADEKEQVELLERLNSQWERLNVAGREYTNWLARVENARSADATLRNLQQSAQRLVAELHAILPVVEQARDSNATERPIRRGEYAQRSQEALQKLATLREQWKEIGEDIIAHEYRIDTLTGPSGDFWESYEIGRARVLAATWKFEIASGAKSDGNVNKHVQRQLELYEKYGFARVAFVLIESSSHADFTTVIQSFRGAVGPSAEMATIPQTNGLRVLAAPVDRLSDLSKVADLGNGRRVDEARRGIFIRPRNLPPSREEILAAARRMADGGRFGTVGGDGQPIEHLRKTLEHADVGPNRILLVDFIGASREQVDVFQAWLYWSNWETGDWFLTLHSKTDDAVRFFLAYQQDPEQFARGVEFGQVVEVDQEKRLVVIRVDPEKITPQALLQSKRIQNDPNAGIARHLLREMAAAPTLAGIAKKTGTGY